MSSYTTTAAPIYTKEQIDTLVFWNDIQCVIVLGFYALCFGYYAIKWGVHFCKFHSCPIAMTDFKFPVLMDLLLIIATGCLLRTIGESAFIFEFSIHWQCQLAAICGVSGWNLTIFANFTICVLLYLALLSNKSALKFIQSNHGTYIKLKKLLYFGIAILSLFLSMLPLVWGIIERDSSYYSNMQTQCYITTESLTHIIMRFAGFYFWVIATDVLVILMVIHGLYNKIVRGHAKKEGKSFRFYQINNFIENSWFSARRLIEINATTAPYFVAHLSFCFEHISSILNLIFLIYVLKKSSQSRIKFRCCCRIKFSSCIQDFEHDHDTNGSDTETLPIVTPSPNDNHDHNHNANNNNNINNNNREEEKEDNANVGLQEESLGTVDALPVSISTSAINSVDQMLVTSVQNTQNTQNVTYDTNNMDYSMVAVAGSLENHSYVSTDYNKSD